MCSVVYTCAVLLLATFYTSVHIQCYIRILAASMDVVFFMYDSMFVL